MMLDGLEKKDESRATRDEFLAVNSSRPGYGEALPATARSAVTSRQDERSQP